MKITSKKSTSFGKKNTFFWHFLLVFTSSVFTSNAINAEEFEKKSFLDYRSQISAIRGTLTSQDSNVVSGTENIYITPGTIIYGAENIISAADNFKSEIATTKKKSFDENNILGISKAFVTKEKSKDLALKHNQEKSIEKAKHTSFLSLSNSQIPFSSIVVINTIKSTSSKFSFDILQNTKEQQVSIPLSKSKIEKLHSYFIYFENETISKSLLRGPPTI